MAGSTYSVNLKLDTKKVRDELRTLEKRVQEFKKTLAQPIKIENRKQQLQAKEKQFLDKKGAQMARIYRLETQMERLRKKGADMDVAEKARDRAKTANDSRKLETARAHIRTVKEELIYATRLLQLEEKRAGVVAKTRRSTVFGEPFRADFKERAKARRARLQHQVALLEAQGQDVGPMRKSLGKMTDAWNQPIRQQWGMGTTGSVQGVDKQGKLIMRELPSGVPGKGGKPQLGRGLDPGMLKEAEKNLINQIRLLKNRLRIEKEELKIQKQQNAEVKKGRSLPGVSAAQARNYGPQAPSATGWRSSPIEGGRFLRGSPLNRQMRSARRQSTLISGGFPLLFGSGPGTALAGAAGGFIGETVTKGGGFAGGIAATAAVTAITGAVSAVAKLGQAFNALNPDINTLIGTLGIAGTEEERRIRLIEKTQGAQAALAAVTEAMNEKLGVKAVESLKRFGEASQRIGNAFSVLGAKVQAALAPLLEMVANIVAKPLEKSQRDEAISGVVDSDPVLKRLNQEILETRSGGGGRSGAKRASDQRNILMGEIEQRKNVLYLLEKSKKRLENNKTIEEDLNKTRRRSIELLQAKVDGNYEEVLLAQEINDEIQKRLDAGMKIMEINVQNLETNIKLEKSLTKQADLKDKIKAAAESFASTVRNDITEGIKGLIKGTSKLSDVLNQIADRFLDIALNQTMYGNIAGQYTKGATGGIFGSLGGLFGKASGGPVTGGSPYVVGEKGPELFVPRTSGSVVPNNAMGGMTINVDASGTAVEGDADRSRELGQLIGAAVQAEIGKQQRPGGMLY